MTLEKIFDAGHCGAWMKSGGTILDVMSNEDLGGYDLIYTGEIIKGGDKTETAYDRDHFESLKDIAEKWPQADWQPSPDCECPLCDK
mgnify:CR=1 FL=1